MPPQEEPSAGAPLDLLQDSAGLMGFLTEALQQLEVAQGGQEDAEAREALAELKLLAEQTAALQAAGRGRLSDMQLASHMDNLDAQLTAVEQQLAIVRGDGTTMELLGASTSRWLGQDTQEQQQQQQQERVVVDQQQEGQYKQQHEGQKERQQQEQQRQEEEQEQAHMLVVKQPAQPQHLSEQLHGDQTHVSKEQ